MDCYLSFNSWSSAFRAYSLSGYFSIISRYNCSACSLLLCNSSNCAVLKSSSALLPEQPEMARIHIMIKSRIKLFINLLFISASIIIRSIIPQRIQLIVLSSLYYKPAIAGGKFFISYCFSIIYPRWYVCVCPLIL